MQHQRDLTPDEELALTLAVMTLIHDREPDGTYGMVLGITEFGETTVARDGSERPAIRQTITFATNDGIYWCVGDGTMTMGEHLLAFDEMLELKGVVRALTADDA